MPLYNPPSEERLRVGVEPSGTKDGSNRTFFLPEPADDPLRVEAFHNGRRMTRSSSSLDGGEYSVSESVPGAGYDMITFVTFSPVSRSTILFNFYAI